jgi:hypothetical protein
MRGDTGTDQKHEPIDSLRIATGLNRLGKTVTGSHQVAEKNSTQSENTS